MSSRAGLDTGEDTKVVPLPELHVIFFPRLPILCVSYYVAWAIPDRSCFAPWRTEELWS